APRRGAAEGRVQQGVGNRVDQVETADRIGPVVGDRDRVGVAGARHEGGRAVGDGDLQVGRRYRVAEVVGRIDCGDRRAGRVVGVVGDDGADVDLLAGQGGGRRGVGPGLGRVDQAVAVRVAGDGGGGARMGVGGG